MTADQKARLMELLPKMSQCARRQTTQNDYNRAWNDVKALESFLLMQDGDKTAAQWIEIAEKATEETA